jgi:hypothetical protein
MRKYDLLLLLLCEPYLIKYSSCVLTLSLFQCVMWIETAEDLKFWDVKLLKAALFKQSASSEEF